MKEHFNDLGGICNMWQVENKGDWYWFPVPQQSDKGTDNGEEKMLESSQKPILSGDAPERI